ncbi:unnamed protein product [Commensalibacter communis]|uniref:hypothetical protein n=1 Tax=Commensalibacter communis TaxID=2972786 RepID=UPI0022FF58E4|nr:hypothetical protein [Commensalibacter communis]CAI3953257.1 unnamed protein product [Commensalibacter communis]
MVRKKSKSVPVKVKAPKDNEFPALKALTHEEIYNLIAKFTRKVIPIKGARLSIINDSQNRTSTPKSPYITLKITERKKLSPS